MRSLLLVVALATLGACPSAPRPILTDLPQTQPRAGYRYVAVGNGTAEAKAIESMVEREAIVARYAEKGRVAYVVRDTKQTAPLFDRVPFRALDKATLVVHIARVSDINGWGVEVNGEVHRTNTLRLELSRSEMPRAFELLQRLQTEPLETIAAVWPHSLAAVDAAKEVAMFERGYVIDVEASLEAGNPFDHETRVSLYDMAKRTGYTRL